MKTPVQTKTKKQVLFLHSAGPQGPHQGSGDLVAYLRSALGPAYKVLHPKMPHPEDPDYLPWKTGLGKALETVEDRVILVGHSLGGSVLLKYLSEEKFTKSIAGLFLVATPFWGLDGWEYDAFYLRKDFASTLPKIPTIHLYQSRGDEVVAISHITRHAKELPKAIVHKLSGSEHVFTAGLPELVEDIKNL